MAHVRHVIELYMVTQGSMARALYFPNGIGAIFGAKALAIHTFERAEATYECHVFSSKIDRATCEVMVERARAGFFAVLKVNEASEGWLVGNGGK